MSQPQSRTALLAGASGLVGREILAALLLDPYYTRIHTIGRRTLNMAHPKLVEHVVDFANLTQLPPVDDVFLALGTTIKVAGSEAAFRAVDFDAIVAVARCARAVGATKVGAVSALGANAQSSVFYSRTKGEAEEALCQLGFSSVVLARPSLLAGARQTLGQAARPGERVALAASRWLGFMVPAAYRAIQARDVACALIGAVKHLPAGIHHLQSRDMQGAANHPQGA